VKTYIAPQHLAAPSDTPDLAQTHQFLRLLAGDDPATTFHFRTFADKPTATDHLRRKLTASLADSKQLDRTLHELADLNRNGAGVFVVINAGGQRKVEINAVRAVFADFDGASPRGADDPLTPHIVIESSPGNYHLYWLVRGLPVEQFEGVQKAIAAKYGSDPAVHDLPRVMRIPGFFHHKHQPCQTQLLAVEDHAAYSAEAVLAAFSPVIVSRNSTTQERAGLVAPITNAYLAHHGVTLPNLPSMRGAFGDSAIEGERHEKLVSYIGTKIAAGRDLDDVRLMARGWNAGLRDPLSSTEVDVTVTDCFRRYAAQKPEVDHGRSTALQLRRASDIERQPISWLWRDWLAKGKLHVLAGPPGSGKTTVALSVAAILSRGALWPDGTQAEVGNVLMWSGEDAPEDTLAPRLQAAGANLDRVFFVGDVGEGGSRRAFDPATDNALLEAEAIRIGNVALLIVDPIVNAVTGDSHKNTEVRRALQPLVDLGARLNAAVLGISHFSKGSQGRQPTERVTGSLAFGALARVVMVAVKNEGVDGTRTLARSKSNIGPDSGGFTYKLEQVDCDGILASRVSWGEHVAGSALQLLNEAEAANTRSDDARLWLEERLANGPVEVAVLKEETKGSGMSWRTLERVKKELHAVAVRVSTGNDGKGSWYWQLLGD
jgi:hypothetical protein